MNSYRRFTVCLLISLFAFLVIGTTVYGQETTPEVPSETLVVTQTETATTENTPAPTETPVPTQENTATPMPTDTPSLTPENTLPSMETALPTQENTSTEVQVDPTTITPTSESTNNLPLEPPLTQIFSDNFETSDLSHWVLGNNWTIVPNEVGNALYAISTTASAEWVTAPLANVVLSAHYQSNNQNFLVYARAGEVESYAVRIDASGLVSLERSGMVIASASMAPDVIGTWHTLRFSLIDTVLRITIDGVEVIAVQDNAPLFSGTIRFAPESNVTVPLYIDDFTVSIPTTELASATETQPSPELLTSTPDLTTSQIPEPLTDSVAVQGFEALAACDYDVSAGDTNALIAAIDASNANSIAETICLGGGTYMLDAVNNTTFITLPLNPFPTASKNGLPLITGELIIEGNGSTITRANGSPNFRMFEVNTSSVLTLHDLTFTNAQATAGLGAIYVAGQLSVENGTFSNNVGAIYIASNGVLTATNTSFQSNGQALENGGTTTINGGIFSGHTNSAIDNKNILNIDGTTFDGNSAPTSGGGAILNEGYLTVTNAIFLNNSTSLYGGAIYHRGSNTSISNSVFRLNSVTDPQYSHGSAIYANPGGTVTITNSCIADNTSVAGFDVDHGTTPITATNNWWGAADGPSGDGIGSGDSVSGTYVPFLTSPILGCTAPVLTALGQSVSASGTTPLAITLTAFGGIPPYTFGITQNPANGVLSGTGASQSYTANSGFSGADPFNFTVTDSVDTQANGVIQVFVDAPATANIVVNSTAQEVPFVVNGNCTIGEAIVAANTNAPVDGCAAGSAVTTDVIELSAGNYTLSMIYAESPPGSGNTTGLPIVSGPIIINGNNSTIQRSRRAFRLMQVSKSGNLVLNDLTLANGIADAGGAVQSFGSLTLNNVNVQDSQGSGISMNDHAPLIINGGSFTNNETDAVSGSGSVTIDGATFSNNPGSAVIGGQVTVRNSIFDANGAGAVRGSNLNIDGSTFTNNTGAAEIGVVTVRNGSLILSNSTIKNTHFETGGGAVYIFASEATLTNNIITGTHSNVSTLGSGIFIQDDVGIPLTASNVTVSNSCIAGNLAYGIWHNSTGTLNAQNNWWGASDGPRGIGAGGGDVLRSTTATYTPFLTSPTSGACDFSYPPSASDQSVDVVYATPQTIPLIFVGGVQPFTFSLVTPPTHGSLSDLETLPVYSPDEDFTGTDSFVYRVQDSLGQSDTATVSIQMVSTLVFSNQTISTYQLPVDFTLQSTGGAQPITYSVFTEPGNGTVSGTSPDFTFDSSTPNFVSDTIVFQAKDAAGFTREATITIVLLKPLVFHDQIVHVINPGVPTSFSISATGGVAPYQYMISTPTLGVLTGTAPNLQYQFNEGQSGTETLTVTVMGADSVTDTGTIKITTTPELVATDLTWMIPFNQSVTETLTDAVTGGVPPYNFSIPDLPSFGTLTGTLPEITYTPNTGYAGSDSFTYQVTDDEGTISSAIVNVLVSQELQMSDQPFLTGFETPVQLNIASTGGVSPFTYTVGTPTHGTVSGTAPALTYIPDDGFDGTDSFTVTIEDSAGATSSALITVEVGSALNVAASDVSGLIAAIEAANARNGTDVIVLGGGTYSFSQSYSDSSVQNTNSLPRITDTLEIRGNGATLNALSARRIFMIDSGVHLTLKDMTLTNGRTASLSPSGTDSNLWAGGAIFNRGSLNLQNVNITTSRAYRGGGIVNYGTVNIEGGRLSGNTAVDWGGAIYVSEAASLQATGTIFAQNDAAVGSAISLAEDNAQGVVTASCIIGNTNTSIHRFPRATVANFQGNWWGHSSGPEVASTAGSGIGDKVSQGVDITNFLTSPVLDCPQAIDQSFNTAYLTPVSATLSGTGSAPFTFTLLSSSAGTTTGTLPDVVYTPGTGTVGAERVLFRVTDVNGLSAVGAINVSVATDLVAASTSDSTSLNTPLDVTLSGLGGTTPYMFNITASPLHGTLSGTAPNLTYTPNSNYAGPDSLTYSVMDALGDTATATVSITVAPLSATNQTLTTSYGTELDVTLSAQGGSTPYTFAVLAQPAHGILFGNAPALVYISNAGYSGADSFTFTVTDDQSLTVTGTVLITVDAASGATITVNSTLHENPFVNNGNCTLGEAIWAANKNLAVDNCAAGQAADTIVVPAGTYQLTGPAPGESYYGLPRITDDVVIRGARIGQTIIEATVADLGAFDNWDSLRLEGVTIRNVNVGFGVILGGAIRNRGQIVVYSSRFEFNTGRRGAAIYTENINTGSPAPSVKVINSEFFSNTAGDGYGGALYGRDKASLEVLNSLFQGNSAFIDGISIWWTGPAQANGNCLLETSGGNPKVITYGTGQGVPPTMDARLNWWGTSGTAVSAASADTNPTLNQRPAICGPVTAPPLNIPAGDENALIDALNYANTITGPTTITLAQNSTYALTNIFSTNNGVGLLPTVTSQIIINANGATLTRTVATDARIFTVNGGSLTLNTMTITNGRGTGGAVFVLGGGKLFVNNSTFRNNGSALTSNGSGGAIAGSDATMNIIGSRFEQNFANGGGALYAGNSVLSLQNNVFTQNNATSGSSVMIAGLNRVQTAQNNCFVQNNGPSVVKANNPNDNTTTTFTNNWWGTADGPSGSGAGSGDQVNQFVLYNPFLTTAPAGCTTVITTPLSTTNQSLRTLAQLSIPVQLNASGGRAPYTFTILRRPANGSMSENGANIQYSPSASFSGTDSFEFQVRDSAGAQASGVITITVVPLSSPITLVPTATPTIPPVATMSSTPSSTTGETRSQGAGTSLANEQSSTTGGSQTTPSSVEPAINRWLPRPVLLSPNGIATVSNLTPSFAWRIVETAAQYQIQVTATTTFLRDLVEDSLVGDTSFTSLALEDGVYLWRVRSIDANGDTSLWSDVRMLTVDTTALSAPTLLSPVQEAVTSTTRPLFHWASIRGAYRYQVVIAGEPTCRVENASAPQRGLNFRPPTPLAQGIYYWCVMSVDQAGNLSTSGEVRSFTVNITTAPTQNEVIISEDEGYTALMRWALVPGATAYTIQIDSDASMANATKVELGNVTRYRVENELPFGVYYWEVIPNNLPHETPVVSKFTISPPAPQAPALNSFTTNPSDNSKSVTLSWHPVEGAVSYEVEVTDETENVTMVTVSGFEYLFPLPKAVSEIAHYTWRVRAVNEYDLTGSWSDIDSFTIEASLINEVTG